VDQSHVDSKIMDQHPTVEVGVSQEPSNGHMLPKRNALNDMAQRGRRGNTQIEKEKNRSHGAEEGQQKNPNEVTPGDTARDTEGEKEKEKPFEESLPNTNVQANNRVSQTNISLGYSDIRVEGGIWASGHMAQFLLLLSSMLEERRLWRLQERPKLIWNQSWTYYQLQKWYH